MKKSKLTFAVLLVLCLFFTLFSFPLVLADEDFWVSKAPLPLSCWGIVALNDKIYAIGGSGEYGNFTYSNNAVFEYDPNLDVWTLKNLMPIKRYNFALCSYENRIYVIGEPDGLNQVYNPVTDSWENRTFMPTPRTQLEANVVDGKIYLIAGRTGGANSTIALNEVYDIETDTWITKESIPYPVVQYASAVVNKKIYVFGGQNEYELPLNLNATQIYDTLTDTWTFGATLPKTVWQASAGATTGNLAPKRIYVIGGLPEKEFIGVDWVQIYNPETNNWTSGESMPTARFKLDVVVLNDILYVMRGSPFFNLNGIYSYENEQYTPAGYIPENNLILSGFLFLGIIFLTMKLVYIRKEKNEKQ